VRLGGLENAQNKTLDMDEQRPKRTEPNKEENYEIEKINRTDIVVFVKDEPRTRERRRKC
jgi:hypothetical protein